MVNMASNSSDGILDSRFFSTKKINVLFDDDNTYLLWRQQFLSDDSGGHHENLEFDRFE
ncbi:hypothetical protein Golax_014647 [Gossypium laxum]|uniref:Uncharacterized protein n=1 Tax=Gossypium laxum TaxID=34288 RepID=A0A7J8ZVG5_9ROSI|nr:hypothetical protein [Gossypium laxum]